MKRVELTEDEKLVKFEKRDDVRMFRAGIYPAILFWNPSYKGNLESEYPYWQHGRTKCKIFFHTTEERDDFSKLYEVTEYEDTIPKELFGMVLGHYPVAVKKMVTNPDKDDEVWLDYYGLSFMTERSIYDDTLEWLERTYDIPEEWKSEMTFRAKFFPPRLEKRLREEDELDLFLAGIKPAMYVRDHLRNKVGEELMSSERFSITAYDPFNETIYFNDVAKRDEYVRICEELEDYLEVRYQTALALGLPPVVAELELTRDKGMRYYMSENVYVNYYGVYFTVSRAMLGEALKWLEETYDFPEEIRKTHDVYVRADYKD